MAAKKVASRTLLSPSEAARAFRRVGAISLWVGRFKSEEELEIYIDGGDFERDVGYSITRGLEPFHAFAASRDALFAGYGFDPKTERRLQKALDELGVDANAALLESDFRFEPERVRGRSRARLQFLGSFRRPT